MYSFTNDYSEGAHQKVLDLMVKANLEQNIGYGLDVYSDSAKKHIKDLIEDEKADIHFIPGGTHANLLAISSFLRPHQSVISSDIGHIVTNETGAIEATGHKIIVAKSVGGKLTPEGILSALNKNSKETNPSPRMVYISNATEVGTVYTKEELTAISNLCKEKGLILFMDGARLGTALASKLNDMTFKDIADLTDVFYIGGTKNGAYLGEALVITRDDLKEDFRFLLKQKGAMLAKGFLLGIQFKALFEDNLFLQLATYANEKAEEIVEALKKYDYTFLEEPSSNIIFPILPNELISELEKEFSFSIQEGIDDENSVIRLVTSWATTEESVAALVKFLDRFHTNR